MDLTLKLEFWNRAQFTSGKSACTLGVGVCKWPLIKMMLLLAKSTRFLLSSQVVNENSWTYRQSS